MDGLQWNGMATECLGYGGMEQIIECYLYCQPSIYCYYHLV
jgi:hypothetical protein